MTPIPILLTCVVLASWCCTNLLHLFRTWVFCSLVYYHLSLLLLVRSSVYDIATKNDELLQLCDLKLLRTAFLWSLQSLVALPYFWGNYTDCYTCPMLSPYHFGSLCIPDVTKVIIVNFCEAVDEQRNKQFGYSVFSLTKSITGTSTDFDYRYNCSPWETTRNPFLGVTHNTMYTFATHCWNQTVKFRARNHVLKALTGTTWGRQKETVILTYQAIGRSVTDYVA